MTEIEVFTTDEVAQREAAVRDTVKGEYEPKLTEAHTKLTEAERRAADRAAEVVQARKTFTALSEEQVTKLDEASRTIYENQKQIAEGRERETAAQKTAHESSVVAAIRSKVGKDDALFTKVKGMYDIVALQDDTAEQIVVRVNAALGALGTVEPDLLASAGFSGGGSFEPPKPQGSGEKTYADTPEGKAAAALLGLKTEAPK